MSRRGNTARKRKRSKESGEGVKQRKRGEEKQRDGEMEEEEERVDETPEKEGEELLPTRQAAAEQLLIGLKRKQLVIIEGCTGSGKTFMAGCLARQLNLPFRSVQMGDQVDAKSLFGSYTCSEVAGHFRWKPSLLHKWLREPCVIVVEDVDTASAEVVCELAQLGRNRKVDLPSGQTLTLHPDALLVATSISRGKRCAQLYAAARVRVELPPLRDAELRRLTASLFPRVAHLSSALCRLFHQLQAIPPAATSRTLNSTDFLRGMGRLARVAELSRGESILLELLDCCERGNRRQQLAETIACALSLNTDQLHTALAVRTPDFGIEESHVRAGRAVLPRNARLQGASRSRGALGKSRAALVLLERLAVVVAAGREAALLVGEAGVGKTSIVQALADAASTRLVVVNVGPHSDADDLIYGYKPTTHARMMQIFTNDFIELFNKELNGQKNTKFLENLERCLRVGHYDDYLVVAEQTALKMLQKKATSPWADILVRARKLRDSLRSRATPFTQQRGAVAAAAEQGDWLLVDEVNLASPECLDAIMHTVAEKAHPNFRLFACMNPATDSGKRRLPDGVRTRFTEFVVEESDSPSELTPLVSAYLPAAAPVTIANIVNFYIDAKKTFPNRFSLRTLCRALMVVAEAPFRTDARNLYEAFSMAFLSTLDTAEKATMSAKLRKTFPSSPTDEMRALAEEAERKKHVVVEGYAIPKGELLPKEGDGYVLTTTVRANLAHVARIIACSSLPLLLEGETSAGKTSIIQHLAALTGNRLIRINNHEHTDMAEYMGSYVADAEGRLLFREGPLVEAVRKGFWIILDELNLAPTDVIEALNRLLDDNRELFVAEENVTLRAHAGFRLFATQNPAGTYGGRKRLSRALLSRFAVVAFPQLPLDELADMVVARARVAPSAAKAMLQVLQDLRLRRSVAGLFSSRDGLMTLRDVFRWARRLATDPGEDWKAALLHHGFFLLAGRCRNDKDEEAVIEVLEKNLKGSIKQSELFAASSPYFPTKLDVGSLVLTASMRRLLVLSFQAWLRDEAVLVVGETGEGKTRLAECLGQGRLLTINCHERTETSDLLGRLRPDSSGGFAWMDGVVVTAMKEGRPLLIDEISLAEDSVLERLNPLFEEARTLLLSDAGADTAEVAAADGFHMIATMNPGGDYGKKELSKALRNRFTEIWTWSRFNDDELTSVFLQHFHKLLPSSSSSEVTVTNPEENTTVSEYEASSAAKVVIKWIKEYSTRFAHLLRVFPSVRDVVACAEMYASLSSSTSFEQPERLLETLSATFLDALPAAATRSFAADTTKIIREAVDMLGELLPRMPRQPVIAGVSLKSDGLDVGELRVPPGPLPSSTPKGFSLSAPTCARNVYRLARALLIDKPILLEGSPGCGKSSTVLALAQLCGYPITRLNLSEQTDLADLFGSDVPTVDGEGNISFRWHDGPVLKAIKDGEWILLDEMNLASQSVLEGLNACLDHRRVLYIAELAKEFIIPADSKCRFFACQNPTAQGGNRKALPKSFINRFTNIYVDELAEEDQLCILEAGGFAEWLQPEKMRGLVRVNGALAEGHWSGGPFSFNLRDLLRCIQLAQKMNGDIPFALEVCYVARFRREEERARARELIEKHLGVQPQARPAHLSIVEEEGTLMIGPIKLTRNGSNSVKEDSTAFFSLASQSHVLQQLAAAADMSWLSLVVGARRSGRKRAIETLATLSGRTTRTLALNADTDAAQLIGSYEQRVDEEAIARAGNEIVAILKPTVPSEILESLANCEDVLQLEKAVEVVLAKCQNESLTTSQQVESVRTVLSASARCDLSFEWVDSVFVEAFTQGDWLIIEDVNLCSSAVLDRLNTCLEADGELVISERSSSSKSLKPHPDFRVFLLMDHTEGEISRAMRNRSMELFVAEQNNWNARPSDVCAVVGSIAGKSVSRRMGEWLYGEGAERALHAAILLSEMDEEATIRAMGGGERMMEAENQTNGESIEVEETEEEGRGGEKERADRGDEGHLLSLTVQQHQQSETKLSWLIEAWIRVGRMEESSQKGIALLAVLSASIHDLKHQHFRESFGVTGSRIISRCLENGVLKALPSTLHPLDVRFHGARQLETSLSSKQRSAIERIISEAVLEWALQKTNWQPIQENSAVSISSLSQYDLRGHALFFNGVELAQKVDEKLRSLLEKNGELTAEGEQLLAACLAVICLLRRLRQPLSTSVGALAIRVAAENASSYVSGANSGRVGGANTVIPMTWLIPPETAAFLEAYASSRATEPFCMESECERFAKLLAAVVHESKAYASPDYCNSSYGNSSTDSMAAPSQLGCHLLKLERTLASPCTNALHEGWRSVMSCVRWRKGAELQRETELCLLLAESISLGQGKKSGEGEDEEEEEATIPIGRLATLSAAQLSLGALWQALSFDSSLRSLSVKSIQTLSLEKTLESIWKLAPSARRISKDIKRVRLELLGADEETTTEGGEAPPDALALLRKGVSALSEWLPPSDCVDPVVHEEEKRRLLEEQIESLNRLAKTLAHFRDITNASPENVDENSSHPFISAVFSLRRTLAAILESKSELCGSYRRVAKEMSALVMEMHSMHGLAKQVLSRLEKDSGLGGQAEEEASDSFLQLTLAQLRSFQVSAINFIHGVGVRFPALVDIFMPFWCGAWVARVAAAELADMARATLAWRQMTKGSCLPPRLATPRRAWFGVWSPQLAAWATSSVSPLPLPLKAALIEYALREDDVTLTLLEATAREWKKWYERHVAKATEKEFVYKSKTMEEKDEAELEEFFDLQIASQESATAVLSDEDVLGLLEAPFAKQRSAYDTDARRLVAATAWLARLSDTIDAPAGEFCHTAGIDAAFCVLNPRRRNDEGGEKKKKSQKKHIDVYREAESRQIEVAADLLAALVREVRKQQELWPEVSTLGSIIEEVDAFLAAPLTSSLMKMATLLERVLQESEEWERIADRAHSLESALFPLRELLVEWKREEVRSWPHLLTRVEREAAHCARLAAFPLFEALLSPEANEKNLLAHAIFWIKTASLVDYEIRLRTVVVLSKWCEVVGKHELARNLLSAASYFSQFSPRVSARLGSVREPISKSLADFVRIARYNDLNLANIKASSHKNHAQLFKMLKKFNEDAKMLAESLQENLLEVDDLLKFPEYENSEESATSQPAKEVLPTEFLDGTACEGQEVSPWLKRAAELSAKCALLFGQLNSTKTLRELAECLEGLREEITQKVTYEGEAEQKEKQQGRARNRRQRMVALAIRDAQAAGLSARKATLSGEALTEKTLCALPSCHALSPSSAKEESKKEDPGWLALSRAVAAARNSLQITAKKTNQQLSVSTRGHMLGMLDHGVGSLVHSTNSLTTTKEGEERLRIAVEAAQNAAVCEEAQIRLRHSALSEAIEEAAKEMKQVEETLAGLRIRLQLAPQKREDTEVEGSDRGPASSLVAGSAEVAALDSSVAKATAATDVVSRSLMKMRGLESGGIFRGPEVTSLLEKLTEELGFTFESVVPLEEIFDEESDFIRHSLRRIESITRIETIRDETELPPPDTVVVDTDAGLLLVQRLYKAATDFSSVTEENSWQEAKAVDRLGRARKVLATCTEHADKFSSWLSSLLDGVRDGSARVAGDSTARVAAAGRVAVALLSRLEDAHAEATHAAAATLMRLAQVAVPLLRDGYVNPIPDEQKGGDESGKSREEEGDGAAGMGEGKGAKDVTEEMEETGQIEGLKGDEESEEGQEPASKDNERPIEMEEDFPEELRDVDTSEQPDGDDGEEEEEEEEGEEPKIDDQAGEVDEKEEEQLDPKLWDEEEMEKDNEKRMDEDSKGAQDKTSELAAKEDETQGVNEEEKKEKDNEDGGEGEGEKEDEDLENVDEQEREQDLNIEDEPSQPAEKESDDVDMNGQLDQDEENNENEEENDEGTAEESEKNEEKNAEENGENEQMDTEEAGTSQEKENENDLEEQEKKEEEMEMEGGEGGAEKQKEKKKTERGGRKEEQNEEEEEQAAADDSSQASRSDRKGEAEKPTSTKEAEKNENEKEEEESNETEKEKRGRPLADKEVEEVEIEGERVEGEEMEQGEQREESAAGNKEMSGGATLEEAKESRRQEEKEPTPRWPEEKERRMDVAAALEEAVRAAAERKSEEEEERGSAIHLAPLDMTQLAELVTREMLNGGGGGGIAEEEEKEKRGGEESLRITEEEARAMWKAMAPAVDVLAAELSERLRLILEPRRASRFQGDYRTGKRLNMRRLIAYMASEYRKDRIWMRRTKLAERNYQLMLAIDDSASMRENGIQQVTCEGACIVEEALRRVDAGQMSVLKFGEKVDEIIGFGETHADSGVRLLSSLSFSQSRTDLSALLRSASHRFDAARISSSEQLLVILSDGRGVRADGSSPLRTALASLHPATVLFVILDCGAKSINDLSVASFQKDKVTLVPYLSIFPFPLYVVVSSITHVPAVLAEALRQWIEMGSLQM